jgi:streptogramin lyase
MSRRATTSVVLFTAALAVLLARTGRLPSAQSSSGAKSIGGAVTNAATRKPEAGVWVVAETRSLATPFRRIVVTDDQGRFLVPDLPAGDYEVWARGYGLRDAARVKAAPGARLDLSATSASSAVEAAAIYPSSYWLSLYDPPRKSDLPAGFTSEAQWVSDMKLGCMRCHQMGDRVFHSHTSAESWEAWFRQRPGEGNTADYLGRAAFTRTLGDWGARITAGEVPPAPPRPTGVERNVVVTEWEWGDGETYMHDTVATDKRRPTINGHGRLWGVDFGHDKLFSLDPTTYQVKSWPVPTTNVPNRPATPPRGLVYSNPANPHVPTMDAEGRVWMAVQTRRERPEDQPAWAREVIVNVQAPGGPPAALPAAWTEGTHHRQLVTFDPKTETFTTIDTAFGTNHLQFDPMGRLWTSGDSVALGMFDPSRFDFSQPKATAPRAQKAFVSIDPKTGASVAGGGYGITASPDGTVWRTATYIGQTGAPDTHSLVGQNKIIKFDPATSTFTDYPLPLPGRSAIGIDASSDGRIWFGTSSGHLGRFDPKTERFTYWASPGPKVKRAGPADGSADFHYYIFVDRYDTLGLGRDKVILTGANADALVVFDPGTERFTTIRVPYPMGLYHRGIDGRIDDERAGWKGRGLWVNYGGDPTRFVETRVGAMVHVQVRPNPLAE